jgi:hypothetical protein
MPVAPAYGGGGFGGGNMFGADGWWIILLLLVCGGWGNGFGFGGGGGGMFPWMMGGMANTNNDVQRGFDQNAIITGITGVQNAVTSGFGNVQTALCNGFAGVNAGVANGFAQAEIAANARQIADLQQQFALQTQMSNCCCDTRAGIEGVKYAIATENCADRAALSDGIRDLLTAQNANTQRILDTMCQDKIDAKNETIAQLRQELMFARGQASQDVQTAAIQAGQRALANEVEQYVLPTPRPAYIVNNPSCCMPNYGCGCGG